MADSTRQDGCDVHDLLALLQHWFACFHQCGESLLQRGRGIGVVETEQHWQRLMQLSAVIDRKLLLYRAGLAAQETPALGRLRDGGGNAATR